MGVRKQTVAHVQDGIMWTQIKSVTPTEQKDTVYNIEVADDNSYTVNNCIVHNCTYWSIAQSPDKRETTASGIGWELFSQYVRALKEAKPRFFIYENNKSMARAIYESISETFGFEPIMINSALVSAQNRQRFYWVGKRNGDGSYSKVDVSQPEDREILLKDVLDGVADREKSRAIISSIGRTTTREYFIKNQGQMKCEPVCVASRGRYVDTDSRSVKSDCGTYQHLEAREDSKTNALTTVSKDNLIASPVCGRYERSDEAKKCRAAYERGELHHGFHELAELHPRPDGKTNTLSTVGKDNPIIEPIRCFTLPREDGVQTESKQYRVYETDGKSTTCLTTSCNFYQYIAYAVEFDENGEPTKAVSCTDGKTYTVYKVEHGLITIKDKTYPIKLLDGYYIIRKLTVSECKRLQTVPEWYEFPVSDTQAYKMLGNGWTVEVIAHILREIMEE
jgi:DNA (cytosine-5)-methyltransferase 3A